MTIVVALAFGMWIAALNVKYRDVRYAMPFMIQLWMFVTPVIYPVSIVPRNGVGCCTSIRCLASSMVIAGPYYRGHSIGRACFGHWDHAGDVRYTPLMRFAKWNGALPTSSSKWQDLPCVELVRSAYARISGFPP